MDVIELGAQVVVSERVAERMEIQVDRDPRVRAMLVEGIMQCAGQKFEAFSVSYPEDWWQSFKLRWLPGFVLRRFPVRMTVKEWTPTVVYPLIALPDEPRWEIPRVWE